MVQFVLNSIGGVFFFFFPGICILYVWLEVWKGFHFFYNFALDNLLRKVRYTNHSAVGMQSWLRWQMIGNPEYSYISDS